MIVASRPWSKRSSGCLHKNPCLVCGLPEPFFIYSPGRNLIRNQRISVGIMGSLSPSSFMEPATAAESPIAVWRGQSQRSRAHIESRSYLNTDKKLRAKVDVDDAYHLSVGCSKHEAEWMKMDEIHKQTCERFDNNPILGATSIFHFVRPTFWQM